MAARDGRAPGAGSTAISSTADRASRRNTAPPAPTDGNSRIAIAAPICTLAIATEDEDRRRDDI